MTSPADVERDVTILVKTYERPDCLARLVTSIRRFYPRIPILVVDDSASPLESVPMGITRYLHEPHDSLGLAGGRNFALRHVETKYVLVCDDDMVFVQRTDLGRMLRTLETTRFDIVACPWLEFDAWRQIALGHSRLAGTADVIGTDLVRKLGVSSGEVDGLPVYDVVTNFFIAAVDRLGPDPWDASLNHLEHVEFFLVMKERGLLSTSLSDVVVEHHPRLPPHYYDVRMRRARYEQLWKTKRGFERKVFVGRTFTRRDRLVYYYPALIPYVARRALDKTAARLSSPVDQARSPNTGE